MNPVLFKELKEIKESIETIICNDVHGEGGKKPSDTIKTLLETLDPDTVKWFFAETVKSAEYDGRFSKQTKEWAKQYYNPILSNEDGERYGQISDGKVHRVHINQLVSELNKFN